MQLLESQLLAFAVVSTTLLTPFVGCAQRNSAEETSTWSSLTPGPYHIGFRSYFELDYGRRERPWSIDWERCVEELVGSLDRSPDGRRSRHDCDNLQRSPQQPQAAAFRPVLVAIWYPTSTSSNPMTISEYLHMPAIAAFPEFPSRLRQLSETVFKENLFGKRPGTLTETEELAFDQILRMQTRAHRDAAAAAGRFPIVVYHPGAGGSYEENAILAEFLSSHGYVVISSAYQTNTVHVSNDVDQASRSIRDMQFLLQAVSKIPFADLTMVVVIGHSAGAQTLLQWIGEPDCPVTAMVSLDTTLEYTPSEFPGHKQLREALESMDKPSIPVMLFASAERQPDFSRFDTFLRLAPRYEVAISHLRHNDYLSHGALRVALKRKNATGQPSVDVKTRQSYDRLCDTIRLFLDTVVKSSEESRNQLNQLLATGTASGLTVRHRPPQ